MTTRISYTGSYGASINATRYEIAGTTVIDSSRNASFASVASAGNVTGVDLSITGWVYIGGVPVLKGRGAAVSAPSGGSTVDTECRNQLSALLAQLRAVGVIAA
ncbi:MAG TPA: hypothetical protein VN442_00305 [Bryobacteraceae bacterium]|nr:hypothetical protein [Bryobacteraceae bacterium]